MHAAYGERTIRSSLITIFGLWTVLLFVLGSSLATAQSDSEESATDELIRILDQTKSLQGRFSQQQYDTNNVLLGESSGRFAMLRPGYFSWQIEAPDSQLIIATPEFIWHHDIDLETVTRRPVESSGAVSPLQILGGEEDLLRSHYTTSKSADGVFALSPNAQAGESGQAFSSLSLTLKDGVLSGIEIIDALNQRVRIRFEEVAAPDLTVQDFAFTPPDGVDLFHYDE